MNLTNFLIILVLILVIVIPIAISKRNRKQAQLAFVKTFLDHAARHNCNITSYDVFGKRIIGISETGNAILLLNRRDGKDTVSKVELSKIGNCQVDITTKRNMVDSSSRIASIQLRFEAAEAGKPVSKLELYNLDHDGFEIELEKVMADKWYGIAQKQIARA